MDQQSAEERGLLKDYLPDHNQNALRTPELRVAAAFEYAAFQLGQINRKLDKVIAAVELMAVKT